MQEIGKRQEIGKKQEIKNVGNQKSRILKKQEIKTFRKSEKVENLNLKVIGISRKSETSRKSEKVGNQIKQEI